MKEKAVDFKKLFKNLIRTWKYVKKYKLNLMLYIFISLCISGIGIISPYFTSRLLLYVTDGKFNLMIFVALLIFISYIIQKILFLVTNIMYTLIFNKITLNIRVEIVKEIFLLTTSEFDKNSSGLFLDRVRGDCSSLSSIFETISHYLINIFSNIGVLIAIFFVNKIMFVFLITSFIILYIIEKIRINKRNENRKEYLKIGEINTGLSNEFIRGIRDVKHYILKMAL